MNLKEVACLVLQLGEHFPTVLYICKYYNAYHLFPQVLWCVIDSMKLHEVHYPDIWEEKNSPNLIMHLVNPTLLCYRERPFLNISETRLCPKASK